MSVQMAHNYDDKIRTEDVNIVDNVDFAAMLLSEKTLRGLTKNGFKKPSPVQLHAIPYGRCGFDLIIKAKSGTGKTGVFGIIALEMVDASKNTLQVLIIAPTREIAVQIQQVLLNIGSEIEGLAVEYFIGGLPVKDDLEKLKRCHIAVGAPGRLRHLIEKNVLKTCDVRLFVLDEADKLMESSYQADINFIYSKLPRSKQMIAASATYPDSLDKFLSKYMLSATHISPDSMSVLLGLKQFVATAKPHMQVLQQVKLKTEELVRILSAVSFSQCLIFSNFQTRAESLCNNLVQLGWPALFMSATQDQESRLNVVSHLRQFKCRIISTTDLMARGIDAANVDLVINFDTPSSPETYLHRMGRAGRYGSYGVCISIVAEGKEMENFQKLIGKIGNNKLSVSVFPANNEQVPSDICSCDVNQFEQLRGISEETDEDTPTVVESSSPRGSRDGSDAPETVAELPKFLSEVPTVEERIENLNLIEDLLNNIKQDDQNDERSDFDCQSVLRGLAEGAAGGGGRADAAARDSCESADIFQKNVALYNLIKLLVHADAEVNTDSVTSVETLCRSGGRERHENGMEGAERTEVDVRQLERGCQMRRKAAADNITKLLQDDSSHVSSELLQSVELVLGEVDDAEDGSAAPDLGCWTTTRITEAVAADCTCSEDLFAKSFDFILNRGAEHWQAHLCDQHRKVDEGSDHGRPEDDDCFEAECVYGDSEDVTDGGQFSGAHAEWGSVSRYKRATCRRPARRFSRRAPYEGRSAASKRKYPAEGGDPGDLYPDNWLHNRHGNALRAGAAGGEHAARFQHLGGLLLRGGAHFHSRRAFDHWFEQWQSTVRCVRNYVRNDICARQLLARRHSLLHQALAAQHGS